MGHPIGRPGCGVFRQLALSVRPAVGHPLTRQVFITLLILQPHTMHDYLLSVIFGIVEGLTEFLPVSSTAHLRISEALLHVDLKDGYWKMYTIVIQLGAVLCLPVYFRSRIAKFLSTFPKGERGDRTILTHPVSLTMIAFVVTAIPAFLLTKVIGKNLESLYVMGAALLIGGVVMWIIDAMFGEHARTTTPEPTTIGAT